VTEAAADPIGPEVRAWRERAAADPDAFWAEAAARLPWFRRWDRVFEWTPPTFRWFVGGTTNLAHNCLDHQVTAGAGDRTALVYLSERGDRRAFTYRELLAEVERVAAALRAAGVRRGDRLTIYLPICPEAVALMLAAVRIGAIHSVVFAGFAAGALGDRIRASGSRLVVTADVAYRKGKDVRLKEIVDAALEGGGHDVADVVVLRRTGAAVPMRAGRDLTWDEFLARGRGRPGGHEAMEANEPAYILATSGTTARPKLAVHTHGGYQVGIHHQAVTAYGMRPGEVWWSTSDIGWVVGHSYIVYAPLLVGCTSIAYEGAIDHPDPGVVWRTIARERVTGIFTSPTAVRLLMRHGEEAVGGADLSSLERLFCAGEALNPPAWEWLQRRVFRDRVPVMDHWWQTETGGPVIGYPYGVGRVEIRPGSAGVPLAGMDVAVVTPEGRPLAAGEKGVLAIRRPFPGLTPAVWAEPARYAADYWERIPGMYSTGDAAHVDADGYVWFAGRADDVIKIAAHRIGTVEVESAFLRHPAVAEAGVVGRPDPVRGEVIAAFVVLRAGHEPGEGLRAELQELVRQTLGPVAVVGEIHFVATVPKTRSGKIMRRVLRAVIAGTDPGDITTLEDEGSVEEARQAWREMREVMAGRG
jgi:acetyl-CoA synthetase